MTLALFEQELLPGVPAQAQNTKPASTVLPASHHAELSHIAASLPPALRLGTSSWSFPGWVNSVWDQPYTEAQLSKHGLGAYSQHPLLRTVSLDRAFYRPLSAEQYRLLAAQVSDDFRFVVKVPSLISDALIRRKDGPNAGRGMQINPHFLDPALFEAACLQPLLQGLGSKLGALVLQISPLPAYLLTPGEIFKLFNQFAGVLSQRSAIQSIAPEAILAIELRNPEFITTALRDELIAVLKDTGAGYCLGLHAKLPPLEDQLPILRKLWPGPLVCRWNLHSKHGRFGYETAKASYEPFDQLVDADLATREQLARVIAGTLKGGQKAYVTINNKAEGSAPLSVHYLANAITGLLQDR